MASATSRLDALSPHLNLKNSSENVNPVVDVAFEQGADLVRLLSRLAWALLPVKNIEIRFWNAEKPASVELPEEFDPATPLVSFFESVEWKQGDPSRLKPGRLRVTAVDGRIIRDDISWKGESSREGSEFSQLAFFIRSGEVDRIRRNSRQKFLSSSRDWRGKYETATVLATGPSFDWYDKLDLSNDFVVTCNSAVINDEMMDRLQPEVVVFADPIFHFGPSLYAGNFREELRKAAERNDFKILIPEIYAFAFLAALPELEERTFFVPLSRDRSEFNLDLVDAWETKVTKNILTFLMFPLAATFASTIRILGCDGRALSESSYFWGHNKSAQINDKMTNIQKVHPGFFSIDYNDYYLLHCRLLESLISQAESTGRRIHSVAPSKIPALASRAVSRELGEMVDHDTVVALAEGLETVSAEGTLSVGSSIGFVSVNPSLRSRMGHAIHQDLSMKAEVERRGEAFASLAHHDLIPELQNDFALPVFSVMSVEVARAEGARQVELAGRFVEELFSGLAELSRVADLTGATVFLYLGHSSLLAPIASRISSGRFTFGKLVVNLFSGYFDEVKSRGHKAELMEVALRIESIDDVEMLEVVCDSERFADAVWKVSGLRIPALPMAPSQEIPPVNKGSDEGPIRIAFPSHAEKVRGFEVLRRFASRKAREFDGLVEFSFRQYAPWNTALGDPPADKRNVKWLGGELSDDAYRSMIQNADILLLPYCPDGFHYRTSSILTEAFSLGKPVIAVEDSWLSDQVRLTGAGWIMKDMTVSALMQVLREITQTPADVLRKRNYQRTNAWLLDNSIENFVSAITHSNQIDHALDSNRLIKTLDELHRRSGLGGAVANKLNQANLKMKEELRTMLPEPFKNALRPWMNRYRRFRRSGFPSLGGKSNGIPKLNSAELASGLNREKKARLDEGELIREYFAQHAVDTSEERLCIDVGAHYGTSARPLLEDGWKVVAFEPDEKNREKLLSGLKKYIPSKLIIEEFAVSDEEAEGVSFFRSEVSTGISGLSSFHESHASAGSVSTTTLANYAGSHSIDKVDFLKIDTEGFDFHVLRGIPWDLWKPSAILCEFEDRKTKPLGYTWKEMADFLIERNYEIWVSEWHPIIEYGKAHDWNRMFRYPGELSDPGSWGNLLAFQNPVDAVVMEGLLNRNLDVFGK